MLEREEKAAEVGVAVTAAAVEVARAAAAVVEVDLSAERVVGAAGPVIAVVAGEAKEGVAPQVAKAVTAVQPRE